MDVPNLDGFPKPPNVLIWSGMERRKAFFGSRCRCGSAVFAVACLFCGTSGTCEVTEKRFRIERNESAVRVAQADGCAIPSLRILC